MPQELTLSLPLPLLTRRAKCPALAVRQDSAMNSFFTGNFCPAPSTRINSITLTVTHGIAEFPTALRMSILYSQGCIQIKKKA
jgi:hypothetical protein